MSKSNTFETEQLTDAAYYILLSLITKRHGYAIMQYIDQLTNGLISIGPATLYTLLKKMNISGLIDQVDDLKDRKKQYQITNDGFLMLKNEIKRREKMAAHGLQILDEYERME
ncbi:MAG: PadR family transcriptional regulator [Ruminiclostridium sp.]